MLKGSLDKRLRIRLAGSFACPHPTPRTPPPISPVPSFSRENHPPTGHLNRPQGHQEELAPLCKHYPGKNYPSISAQREQLGNASLFTTFLFTIFVPLDPPPPNQQNDRFPLEFLLKGPQTELRTLSKNCEKTLQKFANKQNYEQTGVSEQPPTPRDFPKNLFRLFLTFCLARQKKTLRNKNNLGKVHFMLVLKVFLEGL